jgi:hypothetical protein
MPSKTVLTGLLIISVVLAFAERARGASIEIGQIKSFPGEMTQLPVTLVADRDIAGLNIRIHYDASLLETPGAVPGPLLRSDHRVDCYSPQEGLFNCVVYSTNAETRFWARNGVALNLTFHVKDSATLGLIAPVLFTAPSTDTLPTAPSGLSDPFGISIPHSRAGGWVSVGVSDPVHVGNVSRGGYEIDTLEAGKLLYTDRTYVFNDPIPLKLRGETFIRTLDDERNLTGIDFLSFDIDRRAVVYLSFPTLMAQLPDWTSGWCPRPETLQTTDGSRRLVSRYFPAGTVTLGANRDADMPAGISMYNVIVVAPPPAMAADWTLYQ